MAILDQLQSRTVLGRIFFKIKTCIVLKRFTPAIIYVVFICSTVKLQEITIIPVYRFSLMLDKVTTD